jgi:Leucine-rich repeat (LRR) protein
MKLIVYRYVAILIFSLANFGISAQCSRTNDSLALVSIFNNCLGANWANKTNWLVPGRNISTWYGVKLNATGCVESLIMTTNKLNGALPDEIGTMKALKVLNLANNNLSGNLPVSMGGLTALEELNLSSNSLNGLIHAQFGNLVNLRKMQLSFNNFSGNLAPSLGNLKELVILHLHQNTISGQIPPGLGGLNKLEELLLSQNLLSGSIPATLGNMSKLKSLILSQNKLSGSIPSEIGNLANLYFFYADENQLSGNIPAQIGNLLNLRELWLNKNLLTGSIPIEISGLVKLQKLLLNENMLTGPIPATIGNLTDLVSLHLSDNKLTGTLPASLGNLSNIISLLIGNNMVTGDIPVSFGSMKTLSSLDLHNNRITGLIPSSFGNLLNLKRIYLHDNMLEGCFPKSMQKFCTLSESDNINTSGYNFKGNTNLIFGGDFKRWCSGEGRAKAEIKANTPLCEGSDLLLKGTGGLTFSWSGPSGYASILQNPVINTINATQFGKYTLAVVNENRCTDTISLNIQGIGAVSASGNGPLCEGVQIELKASGGVTYRWSGPNGFISDVQNPVIPDAKANMEGDYIVEIKTSDCIITRKVTIDFVKSAVITTNTPICEGDTLKLSVSSGQSFAWIGPGGFTSSKQSPNIIPSGETGTGKYSVTVKNSDNCTFTLSVDIQVTTRFVPLHPDFPDMCDNGIKFELPSKIDKYTGTWSGAGISGQPGNQIFLPSGLKGVQQLIFTPVSDGSCVGPVKKEFFVGSLQITATEKSPSLDTEDSNGAIEVLIKTNTKDVQLTYTGPVLGNSVIFDQSSFVIKDLKSGKYFINVSNTTGCTDTTSVEVRYLRPFYFLPNVVTSQASSDNGRFYLKGANIYSYDMTIYNRWGNTVFDGKNLSVNEYNQAWITAGVGSGVYVYVVTINTIEGQKLLSGSITVL